MKGNAVGWIWYAVATWLCFCSILASPSSEFEDNLQHTILKEYPTIRVSTANMTRTVYRAFIEEIRGRLGAVNDIRHGIPVLPNRGDFPISQRYVLIEVTNSAEHTITFAMDVTNAYLVGYRAGNNAYFLRTDNPNDAEAITHLFTNVPRQTFNMGGNYDRLEQIANADREHINLGLQPLEDAISTFHYYNTGSYATVAYSFIVVAQMIAEAARYRYIQGGMETRIRVNTPSPPDPAMLSLENSWHLLSQRIQESNHGVLTRPVDLRRPDNNDFEVDNVAHAIIGNIALMLFYCGPRQSISHPFIRLVVPSLNDGVCLDPEPTVHITGANGLCVDVRDGYYHDGNAIQLWPCKSNPEANQLWTIKKDSTIRSKGKCLAAYGYTPGHYVMIYDCSKTAKDAIIWNIWDNGTIVNPKSGVVLGVTSGKAGETLSVQTNTYSPGQSWLPSNNTKPFMASIVGFDDLCLQAFDMNVSLASCSNTEDQKWAIYGDGSIRLQKNLQNCLHGAPNAAPVTLRSCNATSINQRWVFKNDQTIWNLNYGLVMDVKQSDPSLKQIILWPFHGLANQLWYLR